MRQNYYSSNIFICIKYIYIYIYILQDLPGFNGAGLYDSIPLTWSESENPTSLRLAISAIYASLWKYRAFAERTLFGIKHEEALMGILVQPYAEGVEANGVALSLIPFKKSFPGAFINVQHGDYKVY